MVLVDTAGRMQDNEPLMRALAKVLKTCDYEISEGINLIFVG